LEWIEEVELEFGLSSPESSLIVPIIHFLTIYTWWKCQAIEGGAERWGFQWIIGRWGTVLVLLNSSGSVNLV